MTFTDLVRVRPELKQIKEQAQGWQDDDSPEMWDKYEHLKAKLCKCVGWKAIPGMPKFMYSMQAFDIAHKEIFK